MSKVGVDDRMEMLNVEGKHIIVAENQNLHFQQLDEIWK
jgi:hypothetical protein